MAADINAISTVDDCACNAAYVLALFEDYRTDSAALEKFVCRSQSRRSGSHDYSDLGFSNIPVTQSYFSYVFTGTCVASLAQSVCNK